MIRPSVHHRHRRVVQRMDRCLMELLNLMHARVAEDERGRFVCGFHSKALVERAAETPERRTWPWYESEGAKLIFRALDEDRAGLRVFAAISMIEGADLEEVIRQHAWQLVPSWALGLSRTV